MKLKHFSLIPMNDMRKTCPNVQLCFLYAKLMTGVLVIAHTLFSFIHPSIHLSIHPSIRQALIFRCRSTDSSLSDCLIAQIWWSGQAVVKKRQLAIFLSCFALNWSATRTWVVHVEESRSVQNHTFLAPMTQSWTLPNNRIRFLILQIISRRLDRICQN